MKTKQKNRKIIISVLITFIMLFTVLSFPANAFAAEENVQRATIPIYQIYGDRYVGSDYLKQVGLYGIYFQNPEINATAEEIYDLEDHTFQNDYVDVVALGGVFSGPEYDLVIPYFLTGDISTDNNSILVIYDMGEYTVLGDGTMSEIDRNTYILYINNYNSTISTATLYNLIGVKEPGQEGYEEQETVFLLETLNFYRGISENIGVTDLYPAAENFIAQGYPSETFTINNITLFDSEYSFPEGLFPGSSRVLVSGIVDNISEDLISDNSNEDLFIAGGSYLWNNSLEDFGAALELNESVDFTNFNFFSNSRNYQVFSANNNVVYLNFQNQNVLAYNNGWRNNEYRFIRFTNNNIINLSYFYTDGTESGLYLRENMQQLVKVNYLFGEINIIDPPNNFFENVWEGITGFFGGIVEGIGNIIGFQLDLSGRFFSWVGDVFNNIGGLFDSIVDFASGVFDNPLPWAALAVIIGILIAIIVIAVRRN